VDLWIYQSNFLVQRMELHTSDPAAGSAAIRLVLSQYDAITPITVPDSSQYGVPDTSAIPSY
jgi:hypothetical protein